MEEFGERAPNNGARQRTKGEGNNPGAELGLVGGMGGMGGEMHAC